FLSRMSHELRTPLNSILGFSQLIKMDEIPDQIREYVDQIEKGGKHLLSLINEVLDLARVEAGRLTLSVEPVMVVPTVREALDIVSPLAFTGNVSLVFNRNGIGHYQTVRADSQRLMQVLLNLLDNAIKYNVKGGTVIVNLEQRQCPQGYTIRISVADTGRGIPPDALEAIFTPFTRLGADSTSIPGTGIGLALTRRLMEAMGGTITVTSAAGKGSTFSVDLSMDPATDLSTDQNMAHTSLDENPGGNPPGTKQTGSSQVIDTAADPYKMVNTSPGSKEERLFTVLYIEDNVASTKLMVEILSRRPFVRLIPAALGRLGIDIARQYRPDLILLDLHLEDMSGRDVLREITADGDFAGIPVVIVSADATPSSLERLVDDGAYRYMTKPVDVRAMLEMIDTLRSQACDRDTDGGPASFSPKSHSPASHGPEAQAGDQPTRSFVWRDYDIAEDPAKEEGHSSSQQ
ncbi:MAG: ATP-binding response regulator, partial [Acidimicrobiales bacterium]